MAHSLALSTDEPSPHSLNVVTSWSGSFEATMSLTFWSQVVRLRARRGALSSALLKPGLIEKLVPGCWSSGTAGAYWCQLLG